MSKYHLLRASMGNHLLFWSISSATRKWWEYEAQALIPYISNGPLHLLDVPLLSAFGAPPGSWGCSEWLFGLLLSPGILNKKSGVFGCPRRMSASFVSTTTIIPFMPDGWAASAGGFPGHEGKHVAFLMKDLSSYLPRVSIC